DRRWRKRHADKGIYFLGQLSSNKRAHVLEHRRRIAVIVGQRRLDGRGPCRALLGDHLAKKRPGRYPSARRADLLNRGNERDLCPVRVFGVRQPADVDRRRVAQLFGNSIDLHLPLRAAATLGHQPLGAMWTRPTCFSREVGGSGNLVSSREAIRSATRSASLRSVL